MASEICDYWNVMSGTIFLSDIIDKICNYFLNNWKLKYNCSLLIKLQKTYMQYNEQYFDVLMTIYVCLVFSKVVYIIQSIIENELVL